MKTNFANAPHQDLTGRRDIPSLDGMRALSILLVIAAHCAWYFPTWLSTSMPFHLIVGNGKKGVVVFFVISGYLITTLLTREQEKTGTISLAHFYFRRTLRIFPAFYVFIAVMGLLWAIQVIPQDRLSFLAAATFTWTLYPSATGFLLAHTWSLSIEEMFYLLWPLTLLLIARRISNSRLALMLLFAMPGIPIAVYLAIPALRGDDNFMPQRWCCSMIAGCLLSLIQNEQKWQEWRRRILNAWSVSALAILAFVLVPYLEEALPGKAASRFHGFFTNSIEALAIGGILIYVIDNPNNLFGRLLNSAPLRHIGVISYSLYLWQQMFTSDQLHLLPWGFLYAFLAAEASFWLIERPFLKIRGRLESRFLAPRKRLVSA